MTDQEKREKVIKGLECRLDINGSKYKHCLTCDYRHDIDHGQWACQTDGILEDALALLKAQEARVMTLKEAQTALHNDTVVWVELKGKLICAGIHMDGTDYFMMQNADVLDVTDFDSGEGAEVYGKQARCWTSRPTDEQRQAVKWE